MTIREPARVAQPALFEPSASTVETVHAVRSLGSSLGTGAPTGAQPLGLGRAGVSRDEMNLAEFPLAVLSTRVDPSLKTLEFTDHFRTKSGELVERKWIITGADKFGLPTSTDDDVVLGLMRLTMDQGFRERKVYFTRYELLKTLRWSTEGRSYSRLVKSLDRLSGVRIRSANSFYDNVSKTYQTCNFGIIDAYEINDHRTAKSDDGDPPKSFFIWSEMLFDSFRAGFIKKLDLDLYFSLRSSVSRRLYRYLDKHFYFRPVVERPLMLLAFEKLGVSRNYKYVSSVRQQLEPAADELVRLGYLESYDFVGRGEQTVIRFTAQQAQPTPHQSLRAADAEQRRSERRGERRPARGTADVEVMPAASPERRRHLVLADELSPLDISESVPGLDRSRLDLEHALVMRGITDAQASRLVAQLHSAELPRAHSIIAFYDHLVATADQRVSRNKLGFLYRAIEQPQKINVPAEFMGADRDASDPRTGRELRARMSTRPEHRIVRASDASSSTRSRAALAERPVRRAPSLDADDAESQAAYREFFERELATALAGLDNGTVENVYSAVERKMGLLRSVLSPERFKEALEGCVRDELVKLLKIPTYRDWVERTGR